MHDPEERLLLQKLFDEIEETLVDVEMRCLRLEETDFQADLEVIFRNAHNIKGASQLYGLTEFGNLVHSFEGVLTAIRQLGRAPSVDTVDVLLKTQAFLVEWVQTLRTDEKAVPDVHDIEEHLQREATRLLRGGAVSEKTATNEPSIEILPVVKSHRRRPKGNLRVPSTAVDELMQFIGELSIQQSILNQGALSKTLNEPLCLNAIALNHKTIKSLQDLALRLRMQPVEVLFQRLERATREAAGIVSKSVQIECFGSDVLLDKTVLEMITDSMVHLIRNSVDHGIEPDGERRHLGKASPAKLLVRAEQDGGQVVITVEDDGRGMNVSQIRVKALQKGLIDSTQTLTDQQIMDLIFVSGFSTRDEVTELSGRGVGMDVVRKSLLDLGGQIEVFSQFGKGSRFRISIPTSLEIIEGLQVEVAGAIYVAPLQEITELVQLADQVIIRTPEGHLALQLRDQTVPLEDLSDYFVDQRKKPNRETSAEGVVLVTQLHDQTYLALRVSRVFGQQNTVVKPLSEHMAMIPGFSGMTILNSGEPALIMSLAYIGESYLAWTSRTKKTV
jgi:two-component system chemotaxis sensor kinase CheA